MNELRQLLAVCSLLNSSAVSAADGATVLGFRIADNCIYEVAEKFQGSYRNMVASACSRMFLAPDANQKSRWECIVKVASGTTDTATLMAAFSDCTPPSEKQ